MISRSKLLLVLAALVLSAACKKEEHAQTVTGASGAPAAGQASASQKPSPGSTSIRRSKELAQKVAARL